MKIRSIFLLIYLLVFTQLFFSCTKQHSGTCRPENNGIHSKIDNSYFRHRWWNYYKRGIFYAEKELYEKATSNFNTAISKRSRDNRMSRTYGMHFLDYFPHRELGIVLYQTGKYETAKQQLELSIKQYPNAKARYYLDLVRKAIIEKSPIIIPYPTLGLDFKKNEIWTQKDPVILSGIAEDDTYIASITINGSPVFMEGAQKQVLFEKQLDLAQGTHAFIVKAKNLAGKTSKKHILIHIDRQGPLVVLNKLDLNRIRAGECVTISGSVYDEAGISELIINGHQVPINKGTEVLFSYNLPIGSSGIDLITRDSLGNQTSNKIPLSSDTICNKPVFIACADSAYDKNCFSGLFGSKKILPPVIKLKGWTDSQTVFLDKIYLEGQVYGKDKIQRILINQNPISPYAGHVIFFSCFVELFKGENIIRIETYDESGNMACKKISVIRKIPKAVQIEERLSLTVLPFEKKALISNASLAFQDNLINAFFSLNRFRIVERGLLDVILTEQKLSKAKLIDDRTAIKLGKLVAAQSIITGSIIETRKGIEVVSRMIDTETSRVLSVQDVYNEAKDLLSMRTLAEGLANKYHMDFPLVNGLVIQKKGKILTTDLGKDKTKLHRKLIIYKTETVKHPVTGKFLGEDTRILGQLRVTQTQTNISKGKILDGDIRNISKLDKVITK